MPQSKSSTRAWPPALHDEEVEIHTHPEESASSDQESDAEMSFHTIHLQALPQFTPTMYMPYIEVSCMDWTVNDGLYHRFLKWRLKC